MANEQDLEATAKGKKLDDGKSPVHQGLNQYFPRALKAVADISAFGFLKYKSWGGWAHVGDGEQRYENAVGRHTLYRNIDGPFDPESKLLHRAHRAWNALATLELELRRMENDNARGEGKAESERGPQNAG